MKTRFYLALAMLLTLSLGCNTLANLAAPPEGGDDQPVDQPIAKPTTDSALS